MADTGAPWNIPYVENADLVKDYPTDSLALANAIASGLDVAGELVAVKYAVKTDTQVSSGVAGGGTVAVSGLTIAHAASAATNKIYLLGQITGSGNNSGAYLAGQITAGGTGISIGDAASSRSRASGGNNTGNNDLSSSVFMAAFYQPSDTSSVTFGVDFVNNNTSTQTVHINRNLNDQNNAIGMRMASFLLLFEVKA